MNTTQILVLNKSWQPVAVTSLERAFGMLYSGAAQALDSNYQAFDYNSWAELGEAVELDSGLIRTAQCALRIPKILVLQAYDKFPRKVVRFSRQNVYMRDDFTCQYCRTRFSRSNLNLDHVVPRCAGGKTSWDNIVCSCIDCNIKKGGRTPEEAGMRLAKRPRQPTWSEVATLNGKGMHKEWLPFVKHASAAYWNTELKDDDT